MVVLQKMTDAVSANKTLTEHTFAAVVSGKRLVWR
jgi:hypothetical protein